MKFFQESWIRAWRLGSFAGKDQQLIEKLLACYSEPHRKYHTLQHLAECLQQFEQIAEQAIYQNEIEIALWFHDAIYDLKSSENEKNSANWAKEMAIQNGLALASGERIYNLIMITKHSVLPTTEDEKILIDIDLSILGANENRFLEYESQVRQEYSFVPDFIFKTKRKEILQAFLKRPTIYQTSFFQKNLEEIARKNLKKSILKLES